MDLLETILELLVQKESFAVATIINRSGSAPRDVGTRMLIRKDTTITGTIGGGILEARVQQLAADVLADRMPKIEHFVFSAEELSNLDMICGGKVRVMIQYVDAMDPFNLQIYQAVSKCYKQACKAWLVTPIFGQTPLDPFFIPADGKMLAKDFSKPWMGFIPKAAQPEVIDYNGIELLIEPLNSNGVVYIFGAGHISQKLAPLADMTGFRTIVLDDRKTFANRERFPTADEIHVLKDFDSVLDNLQIDADSYLVIVTRGHSHDKTILAQALKSSAGYVGMIGSRRKRDDIYGALRAEGFGEKDFKRIFSPIGLDIGAETPEEIALSIAAELVAQRAQKRR